MHRGGSRLRGRRSTQSLPPDHPLEPGFTAAGRSRSQPSAAVRIAASEAVIESKPPVIPDPGGGKSDFIAAARRAARAAALATPQERSSAASGGSAQPKKMTDRLRTLMVAAAVVVIVVGGFHIVSRFLEDGGSGSPPPAPKVAPGVQTLPQAPQTEPRGQPESAPLDITPPHVETETPPPRASTAPDTIPASPQPGPTPPPGGELGAAFRRVAGARRRPEPNAANSVHTPVSVGFEGLAADGTGRRVAYRFSAMGRG